MITTMTMAPLRGRLHSLPASSSAARFAVVINDITNRFETIQPSSLQDHQTIPSLISNASHYIIFYRIFSALKFHIYLWIQLDSEFSYLHCHFHSGKLQMFLSIQIGLEICVKMWYFALSFHHSSQFVVVPMSKFEFKVPYSLIPF
jgi:hypothetical protein